ncbi:MAG: extracellular solute-binding protein [Spirochaetota bacterium]|nr:MAG: extracellular solute-binding protein [Spirochaetota bacterium]
MKKKMKLLLLWVVLICCFTVLTLTVAGADPSDINWNRPAPVLQRIMGQGPVEVIPPELEDYGVKLAGKKGMLTGYQLPNGWKKAIGSVRKLVLTNSGSLVHDPATALNAKIFEKMTGVHLELIEMKDELIWPKTLSAAMAKSTDVDLFYIDRAMIDTSILAVSIWIYPVDELFPHDVHKLYPDGVLMSMKAMDGHFYAAPLTLWGEYLFYRPSWLSRAGVRVPDTLQDLVAASEKVDRWARANMGSGYAGMVCSIGDPDSVYRLWAMIVYAKDDRIVKNNKVVVDPEVWNLMTDFWVKGGAAKESIEYMWPDAPEVFAKGKAGFIIAGSVFMKNFGNPEYAGAIQGDWKVVASPAWKGVGIHGRSLGEPDTWAINNFISPEKKAAAMLWIDFLRSYQAQFNELYVEGNESCMIPVYDHPVIKKEVEYPEVRAAAVAQHMGESFPPQTEEALEMVKEYLHKVVMGQMDQFAALRDLQKDISQMQ